MELKLNIATIHHIVNSMACGVCRCHILGCSRRNGRWVSAVDGGNGNGLWIIIEFT